MVHLPKTDNTVVCTGYGYKGSLGLDGPLSTTTFTQLGSAQWTWVQIGRYNNFGRRTNGELWSWGYAVAGSVGDIPYPWVTRSSPVQIGSGETWGADFRHGGNNDYGGMAINTSGELFGWGQNTYGQKGGLPIYGMNTPTQIGSETDWTGVDCGATHNLGVRDDS